MGKTYHQKCFTCARCNQPFPSGEKVTYTGKEVLCQKCVQVPVRTTAATASLSPPTSPTSNNPNGKGGVELGIRLLKAFYAVVQIFYS